MTGIILLAHGSRNPEIIEQFDAIRVLVQDRTGCLLVSIAFREFQPPGLPEAVATLTSRGATRILVMPYFLFPGGHVTKDLPGECQNLVDQFPGVQIELTAPLGVHEKLADIVTERLEEHCQQRHWPLSPSSKETLK